jgi:hypothetical protein
LLSVLWKKFADGRVAIAHAGPDDGLSTFFAPSEIRLILAYTLAAGSGPRKIRNDARLIVCSATDGKCQIPANWHEVGFQRRVPLFLR